MKLWNYEIMKLWIYEIPIPIQLIEFPCLSVFLTFCPTGCYLLLNGKGFWPAFFCKCFFDDENRQYVLVWFFIPCIPLARNDVIATWFAEILRVNVKYKSKKVSIEGLKLLNGLKFGGEVGSIPLMQNHPQNWWFQLNHAKGESYNCPKLQDCTIA